jgi:hypothetical protein
MKISLNGKKCRFVYRHKQVSAAAAAAAAVE